MFGNRGNTGGFASLPLATKNLLIINIGLWLLCSLLPDFGDKIYNTLGLHYWSADDFNPIQLITYMFLQAPLAPRGGLMGIGGGIGHIFFNMFALYMFGRILEATWGTRRFIVYYLVCGAGAALVQEVAWMLTFDHTFFANLADYNGLTIEQVRAAGASHVAMIAEWKHEFASQLLTIGASGAVFGLLLGFGCVFPNVPMYIFFIPVPIKAKYLVAGYAVLEFVFGITNTLSMVAHFAHLGGMIFGGGMLLYWHLNHTLHGKRF